MPCDTSVSAAVAPAFAAASRIAEAMRSSVAVLAGSLSSPAGGGAGRASAEPKAVRAVIDGLSANGVGYHSKRSANRFGAPTPDMPRPEEPRGDPGPGPAPSKTKRKREMEAL